MGTNLEKQKKKMSEQRYRKMEGKWLQTKADNVEKFMETQGMSWAKRKIAAKLTPTIIFSFPNDDTLKIEFTTTVMSRVQEYKINGVTKDKDVETEASIDPETGMIVMVTKGQKCGPIKTTRVVDGDVLTLTTILVDKNVSCTRIFKRQK